MKRIFGHPIYAILLAILCAALWGSAVPTVKLGLQILQLGSDGVYGKILFAGVRFLLAAIALLIFAVYGLKLDVRIRSMKMLGRVTALGIMQTAFQYTFMYIGVSYTTAAKSSILTSSGVFFVAILAHLVYKNDRLTVNRVFGLLLGFIGIVIASWGKAGGVNGEFRLVGEGLILAYQLCSAIASILVKRFAKEIHPVVLTVWQMLIGSLILIAIGLSGSDPGALVITPGLVLSLLYLVFVSAVAYTLWNILLTYNKAAEISTFKFVTPAAGAILSSLVLGDVLDYRILISLALVSIGIVAVYHRRGESIVKRTNGKSTERAEEDSAGSGDDD